MSLKEQLERRMAGLPSPCVEIGQTPLTISVHIANGETWVLPWSRFSHARLRGDELTIGFADEEIIIHGQNLGCVLKHVSSFNLETLRTMAARYRPLVPGTEPFISEIELRKERLPQ